MPSLELNLFKIYDINSLFNANGVKIRAKIESNKPFNNGRVVQVTFEALELKHSLGDRLHLRSDITAKNKDNDDIFIDRDLIYSRMDIIIVPGEDGLNDAPLGYHKKLSEVDILLFDIDSSHTLDNLKHKVEIIYNLKLAISQDGINFDDALPDGNYTGDLIINIIEHNSQ